MEEIKENKIWRIKNHSVFRKRISEAAKRVRRRLCALSLFCAFIWKWNCLASGLLAVSNQLKGQQSMLSSPSVKIGKKY